jgi:uncharacterized protein
VRPAFAIHSTRGIGAHRVRKAFEAMADLKTAVVTGASAGIGREIVRQLVRDRRMRVVATARRLDRLESLRDELPEGMVVPVAGDLASSAFRHELWRAAESAFPGGIDLLVNNAGFGQYDEFADQDFEAIRRIFEVNVFALFELTQLALRHMRPRGTGQILQISSVLGVVGCPYSAVYTSSKHAVDGLVKSLRYELKGSGVRVWAGCPNRTESEFHGVAMGDDPSQSARKAPHAVPTETAARAIVRGIDGRTAFLYPTWSALGIVILARLMPRLFDGFMMAWSPGHFRRELEAARGSISPPGRSAP